MTMRLSHSSLTGTERTLVAVGTVRLSVHVLHGAGGGAAQHGVASARRWPRPARPASRLLGHRAGGRRLAGSARPLGRRCRGLATGFAGSAVGSVFGRRLRRGLRRPGFAARLGLAGGLRGCLAARLRRGGRAARRRRRAVAAVCRPARCALKKSHQALSTLFGSAGTARTSRRRATRWRRTRRGGCRQLAVDGGCAFRRLGHGLDRLFR